MEKVIFRTVDQFVVSDTDMDQVGSYRWIDNQLYLWIQNKDSATLVAGSVCYHKVSNTTDFLKKVYGRNEAGAANVACMAGVVMADIAADYYGWVLALGVTSTLHLCSAGGAIAAGDYLGAVDATATVAGGYAAKFEAGYGDITAANLALTHASGAADATSTAILSMGTTIADVTQGNLNLKVLVSRINDLRTDVNALIAKRADRRTIIALEALAVGSTSIYQKVGFVQCI